MLKKIFLFSFFLFLSSCGYEAIYSKKNSINYNFSISELTFVGDRETNLKIKERLKNYTLSEKNKNFVLRISSTSTKAVTARDTSGDAISYKSTVASKIEVLMNNKSKNSFVIAESFNYNNNSNKFGLKRYETEIKKNLAETVSDKLIFKLSNIQ